jgi:tetratricopeptide (TPR) repeat protein
MLSFVKPENPSTVRTVSDPTQPTPFSPCEKEVSVAICLDEVDLGRPGDIEKVKTKLERLVETVKIFNHVDECIDFITNDEDRPVVLIVNETDGENIASILDAIKQIKVVYVLSFCQSTNASWMTRHNKVRGIISNVASIYRILETYKQENNVEFNFVSSFPASLTDIDQKNEQEAVFMYSQLLKYVIIELNYSEYDRIQMIEFLLRQHQCPMDIEKIRDFERRYEQVDPIQWYTKGWFLYRDLNKALREHDVTFLYMMRVFIKDLHQQIVRCHMKQKKSTILKVYRGMIIPRATFDEMKTKSGRLLSFSSFLSTTANDEVALMFSADSRDSPHMTPVIFEIEVDSSLSTSAHYADLSNLTQFEYEEEFLFTMGSVFRIQSIEPPDSQNISRIKLILTDDNDVELTRLANFTRSKMSTQNELSFFLLLILWGKYKELKEIGKLMFPTISDKSKPLLSVLLAYIDFEQGNRKEGTSQLQAICGFPDEQPPIARDDVANVLGQTFLYYLYWMQGEWDLAIENIEALYGINTSQPSTLEPESLGICQMTMGAIRFEQGRYSDALSCAIKAYELLKISLPSAHPYLATCLQLIVAIKAATGQVDQVSIILSEIMKIRDRTLPPDHPDRRVIELAFEISNLSHGDNVHPVSQNEFKQTILTQGHNTQNDPNSSLLRTAVYFSEDKIDDALSSINEYIETVQEKAIPLNVCRVGLLHMLKAELHRKREELAEAMESYKAAYTSLIQNFDETFLHVARTLSRIASIYTSQNNFDEAFNVWERCKDRPPCISREDFHSFNTTRSQSIANIYQKQGFYYQEREKYEEALINFEECLKIQEIYLEPDHIDIARTHCHIGHHYFIQEKYDDALSSYQKSLDIIKVCQSSRPSDLARAYSNVGGALELLSRYPDALVHFENALQIQLESLAPNDPIIANTRKSMALLYYHLGNPDQASFQYSKCLEIDLTTASFSLVDIARGYFIIGALYQEQQQYAKALSSLRESLRIRESCSTIDPLGFANTYDSMGSVFFDMQKFSDALESFQLALDIRLQVTSPTDPMIATDWKLISRAYIELNNYERGIFALNSSHKIEHPEMPLLAIQLLSQLAIQEYFFTRHQHPDVLTMSQQFLNFQTLSLPPDHPYLIHTYRMIGSALFDQKKHAEALENFKRVLDIQMKCSSSTNPQVAIDYWHASLAYSCLNQFDEALSHLNICLSIQTNSLPSYHPDRADTHKLMGKILQQQNKLAEALDNYESASKIYFEALSSANAEKNEDCIKHCQRSLADVHDRISKLHTQLNNSS